MRSAILFGLLLSVPCLAQEAQPPTNEPEMPKVDASKTNQEALTAKVQAEPTNKDESWYFGFGLGGAIPNYGAELNSTIDSLKAAPGYSRTAVTGDLGFYWPLSNRHTVLGASLFFISDLIKANGYEISLNQFYLGFSTKHYFGENVGSGFFLRGDIGPARYYASVKNPSGATLYEVRSKYGAGAKIGLGYGFVLSPETRLDLGLYSSAIKVGSDEAKNVSLEVGLLL